MPLNNAEKCKNYRKRKKEQDAASKIKRKPKTAAERSRMYRLRKKQLIQGTKLSSNEILYIPSTSNSQMFEPSPQPVTNGLNLSTKEASSGSIACKTDACYYKEENAKRVHTFCSCNNDRNKSSTQTNTHIGNRKIGNLIKNEKEINHRYEKIYLSIKQEPPEHFHENFVQVKIKNEQIEPSLVKCYSAEIKEKLPDVKVKEELPDVHVNELPDVELKELPDVEVKKGLPNAKVKEKLQDVEVTEMLPDIEVKEELPDTNWNETYENMYETNSDSCKKEFLDDSLEIDVTRVNQLPTTYINAQEEYIEAHDRFSVYVKSENFEGNPA